MANAAAEAIDVSEMPGVVGTISGDNTFIAIMRTPEDSLSFIDELKNIMNS
jgi:arginine repressor